MAHFIITVEGLFSSIVGDISKQLDRELREQFSWVDPVLLNKPVYFYEDHSVYTGTVNRLAAYLIEQNHTVEIVKEASFPKRYDSKFIGSYRPLQEEAVEALIAARFGFLEAPPSIGKTVIMAATAAKLGLSTCVLVQDTAPFKQAVKTFEQLTNMTVGKVKTAKYTLGQVNIVMVQTWNAAKRKGDTKLLDAVNNSEVVLIDEGHNAQSNTYLDLLHNLVDPKYILAVSGTAFTDNAKEDLLSCIVGEVVHNIPLQDAINNDLIVPITVFAETIPPQVKGGYNSTPRKFASKWHRIKSDELHNHVMRNRMIAGWANDAVAENLSVAVVIDTIEHGATLADLIDGGVLLDASNKDRAQLFEDFEQKKIKCIISTLIDEATDIPTLDVVILACGGKNRKSLLQRSLRCGRLFEGKTAVGTYKKERGFIVLPLDQGDIVKGHAQLNLKHLKEYLRAHEANEVYVNGKLRNLQEEKD